MPCRTLRTAAPAAAMHGTRASAAIRSRVHSRTLGCTLRAAHTRFFVAHRHVEAKAKGVPSAMSYPSGVPAPAAGAVSGSGAAGGMGSISSLRRLPDAKRVGR